MANIEAQIKPTGMSQRNLVDLLYMVIYSLQGICQKLDDDTGVTLTTYEANVYTAIFNGSIEDGRGNCIMNYVSTSEDRFFIIAPTGLTNKALLECLYQIFDMIETLTEQLDTDDLTDNTYEALCYTAILVWVIENCKGDQLGNGAAFYFRNASENRKELVNLLCNILDSMETMTEQLDADGTVTDTDYEELWFTDTVLLRIQDSEGLYAGNDITITP
ncbi:MAG: hypothetical protein D4R45_05665 [Planctomycetaceae bacterium]|nr:MAG: hypothetical protein D4R45_05665 [Planctomycetaceae bacterium]